MNKHPKSPSPACITFIKAFFVSNPDLVGLLNEHLEEYEEELLCHILISDVELWIEENAVKQTSVVAQALQFIETNMQNEDAYDAAGYETVTNLIKVSFNENLPRPSIDPYLDTLLPPKIKKDRGTVWGL